MSKTKRKKSAAGKNVLIFFIVFIILEMIFVVGLSLLFKNDNSTPGIAGYKFYVMKSDAMGDVVPKGSLVVASTGTPSKDKINSAVLCKDVGGIGTSVFWLDSIESKEGQDGVEYTVFQKNDPDTKCSKRVGSNFRQFHNLPPFLLNGVNAHLHITDPKDMNGVKAGLF
jgi:hypothetical protein